MKRVWTKKMVSMLRKEYKTTPIDILAFKLGVSRAALKSKAQVLGIRKRKGVWTKQEENRLRKLYCENRLADIRDKFKGRSATAIYQKAKILGLVKSKEYLSINGHKLAVRPESIAYRFQKNHVPANKGKKESEFRSKKSSERCKATQFKKGSQPHNARPVGYESVRSGYVYIKVEGESRMVMKHRYVWMQHNGPVPEGMCVSFKDGNRLNCDISNLMLITESEKATRVTAAMTPEQKSRRVEKGRETRNEMIRKDRMRIRWGLEPKSRLVKHGWR